MILRPCTLAEAQKFVRIHHRHHGPSLGGLFAVAVAKDEELPICGVAMIGRPVARMLQDGFTAEVTRLCTDGTRNACSMLYGAAWRAARALGYRRLVTYILGTEKGTSLIAAGWHLIGEAGGGSWSVPSRPRENDHPLCRKIRYERVIQQDDWIKKGEDRAMSG